MDPPVMVRPLEEERPPVVMPPVKVEVEILVEMILVTVVEPRNAWMDEARNDPPVRVRPLEDERPVVWKPPETVEEADVPVRER